MKNKALVLLCCLISTSMVFSQIPDSLLRTASVVPTLTAAYTPSPGVSYKTIPLITIKGEEFNKFPSNNFLEALSAFFPWAYKPGTSYGDYTYMVNGNVQQDINAISLYDIEEVSFSRTDLNGALFPFSRAGIFYITTKKGRSYDPIVNFSTQYNIVTNKNTKLAQFIDNNTGQERETDINNKSGHLQSNHLSVSIRRRKLAFYGSAQYSTITDPRLAQSADFVVTTIPYSFSAKDKTRQRNVGGFFNLTYDISSSLYVGISGNYVNSLNNEDSSGTSEYSISGDIYHADFNTSVKTEFHYYHISPYITFKKGRLLNSTRFEYASNDFDHDHKSNSLAEITGPIPSSSLRMSIETISPYLRGYTLRNDLSFQLVHKGKFKLTPGAVFSYINQEIKYREFERVWESNNPTPGIFESWSYARQKITVLNPYILLDGNKKILGYAGHSFILNKKSEVGATTTDHSRRAYYAGAIFDLVSMGIKRMNRLDVSFHYGNLAKNNSDNYWLQSIQNVEDFRPVGQFQGTYSGFPNQASFFRTKQTSVQINSAFFQNRIRLGAEWSKTVEDNSFVISSAVPPFSFRLVPGVVTTTGWGVYGSIIIGANNSLRVTSRINALIPKTKYRIPDIGGILLPPDYKCITGLQNSFKYEGFTAQVNATLGIQRERVATNLPTPTVEKATDFMLNYIMLGHKLYTDKLNVFVHARNLLSTSKAKEYYGYNTYIGAGVQLSL